MINMSKKIFRTIILSLIIILIISFSILCADKFKKLHQVHDMKANEVAEFNSDRDYTADPYSSILFDVKIEGVEPIYELYFIPGNDNCSYCLLESQDGTLSQKRIDVFSSAKYDTPSFDKNNLEDSIDKIYVKYYDKNDILQATQTISINWDYLDNVCYASYF